MRIEEHFCDRCKKKVRNWYDVTRVEIHDSDSYVHPELCGTCLPELKKWLKGNA